MRQKREGLPHGTLEGARRMAAHSNRAIAHR
jgi:hypothetical protein